MEAEDIQVSGSRGAGAVVAEAAKHLERNGRARMCAINFAMPRLIQAVEILKHKVAGLHQINEIEHLEESNKTKLSVTLSFSLLTSSHSGYQAPLPASQVQSVPLSEIAKIPEREEREERPPRREGAERPTRGAGPARGKREPRSQEETKSGHVRKPRHAEDSKFEVVQKRTEEVKIEENEIRITARRPAKYIVKDAVLLLKEKNFSSIVLKASGTAIPNLVEVAERLRHCVAGLHQVSILGRREVTDLLRSKEAGVEDMERTRDVPTLEIVASKTVPDTRHYGYQAPLPASRVKEMTLEEAASK